MTKDYRKVNPGMSGSAAWASPRSEHQDTAPMTETASNERTTKS
jgi:hypothetical protein